MTTGSVRGKCWAPQAGQARRQPASATSEAAPQLAQNAVRGVPAEDALGGGGVAGVGGPQLGHHRPQVAEAEARRQARVALAPLVEEAARHRRRPAASPAPRRRSAGAPSSMPRKTAGPAAAKTSEASGSQASRRPPSVASNGLPRQSARPRARGSAASAAWAAGVAAQLRGPVERPAREGDRLGVAHVLSRCGWRDLAAKPRPGQSVPGVSSRATRGCTYGKPTRIPTRIRTPIPPVNGRQIARRAMSAAPIVPSSR